MDIYLCHRPLLSRKSTITGEMIFRTSISLAYFGASLVLKASFLLDNGWRRFQTIFPMISFQSPRHYSAGLIDGKRR